MGCGGSVPAHAPSGNEPPMVVVRDDSGEQLPSAERNLLSVPTVLERVWAETGTMTDQQRKHDAVLLMNFLRERRSEQQDNREKFSYTLGALLGSI